MIINWLFVIFPAEMRRAWRLVRRDLALWLGLAALLAVLAAAGPVDGSAGALSALLTVPIALLMMFLPVVLFHAAHLGVTVGWREVLALFAERGLGLLLFGMLAALLCAAAATVAVAGTMLATRGSELMPAVSAAVGIIVYLSLFVRFCLLPFVVVLQRREDLGALLSGVRPALKGAVPWLWPLFASSHLTAACRWRLTPYVFLINLGPAGALVVPPEMQLPFVMVWQLTMLVMQGVLFDYFLATSDAWGIAADNRPLVPAKES
ncbi:MAG: hypothetical protein H8E45_12760 [Proteobacteria bacterium]|nr:hypothetical protein [Pseudomonadota bacterium]